MKTGYPAKVNLIVVDTETIRGLPYTIQIYDGQTLAFSYHKREDIQKTFLDFVGRRIKKDHFNVIYAHGLDFDMPVLLHDHHKEFLKDKFIIQKGDIYWEVLCGKFTFGNILFTGKGKTAFYDTFRFTFASLEQSCIDLGLSYRKMEKPEYLGEREPTEEERPYFEAYAKADVYALFELAQWILARCKEFDTQVPISLAHFASIVLRRKFMVQGDSIAFPPNSCVQDSILSYHGGKNGLSIECPVLIKEAYSYDIISAYPWAMSILPSFLKGKYTEVNKYVKDRVGIYVVHGKYQNCRYDLLCDHSFNPLPSGPVTNTCFTSFEIGEALAHGHLQIDKITGWIWEPEEERNPLRDYVEFFYKQKSTVAKESAQYYIAKTLLNALYGKFIQTVSEGGKDVIKDIKEGKVTIQEAIYKAGGLFNPFIGSLITGAVRAKLHSLEHRYWALHSSTDSIITLGPCDVGERLGELKFENKGPMLLIRNKVYLHFKEGVNYKKAINEIHKETDPKKLKKLYEKYIYKAALHGFQADIKTVVNLFKTRSKSYKITRMIRIREAFKNVNLNYTPLTMQEMDKEIDIDWGRYREI